MLRLAVCVCVCLRVCVCVCVCARVCVCLYDTRTYLTVLTLSVMPSSCASDADLSTRLICALGTAEGDWPSVPRPCVYAHKAYQHPYHVIALAGIYTALVRCLLFLVSGFQGVARD